MKQLSEVNREVGSKNIFIQYEDHKYVDCEILEYDEPMYYVKYREGKNTKSAWFHEDIVFTKKTLRVV